MNENISRLMDGEVDAQEFARLCGEMRAPGAIDTWVCYHVIGDQLRGNHGVSTRFSARFCTALAAEPTMLAPVLSTESATGLATGERAAHAMRPRAGQAATLAWAVAATLAAVTVVGWTAFSMVDAPPTAVAKAREAATVRAAQVKPPGDVPADYLIAHQEYSPSMVAQGPAFLRAVAVTGNEPQPRP